MLVCFILQSSRITVPAGKPVNAVMASAPGMPSAPTTPLASAATASPGFMEMGSTVCQKVIDRLGLLCVWRHRLPVSWYIQCGL